MAKITIETDWLITPDEDITKAFRVIKHVYGLLREAKCLVIVELIKANVWIDTIGGVRDVHFVEYQIVHGIPSSLLGLLRKEETLKTAARWQSQWPNIVEVWKNKFDHTSYSNLIGRIRIEDSEIETFAKVLLQAMQMGFCFRSGELTHEASHFSRAEETMQHLLTEVCSGVTVDSRGDD